MFQARNGSTGVNREFIWKTIETARNWLAKKCFEYDDQLMVAALQAMTVYLILRGTEDGEAGHVESDVALAKTLMVC